MRIFLGYLNVLTGKFKCDTMKKLHKNNNAAAIKVECNEGERTLLCSNKGSIRSPSLDYLDTSSENVTEDMILDYLASIISDMYLKELYGSAKQKEGGDILPGIN